MIDTDKIMRTTKILLHGRHINKNEADDYLHLLAEVIRLREGIEQLYESIGTMETQGNIAIRKALKEMIE